MTIDDQMKIDLNRVQLMDLMEFAFGHHPVVQTPMYMEHDHRDANAVKIHWHGQDFRVSSRLVVEEIRGLLLEANITANAIETLLLCAYEYRSIHGMQPHLPSNPVAI